MATDTQATAPALRLYRLNARQFERMIDAGVFPEGAHVELLGGILIDKMTKHQPHNYTVGQAGDSIRRISPPGWHVIEEKSVRLGRSWRPEPDISVIRGARSDYIDHSPGSKDIALIVEVSDVTYAKDRGVKWRRYAAARVPVYVIANLPRRQLELYADPSSRGAAAAYRSCAVYGIDAEVPVVLDGQEVGRIAVKDLLP